MLPYTEALGTTLRAKDRRDCESERDSEESDARYEDVLGVL